MSISNAIAQCSISVNSADICYYQTSGTLTATGSASSYVWSPSAGLSATTGATVSAAPTITTTYTVTGTFGSGCTATATSVVTVHPLPVITINPNPAMICDGDSITVCASTPCASTYEWYPSYGLGNTTGACVIGYPVLTTTYMVVATDCYGCYNATMFNWTNGEQPNLELIPITQSCGDTSGSIQAYTIGGSNSYEYIWNNGMTTQSLDGIDSGFYTVTVTDPLTGCFSTDSTLVDFSNPPIVIAPNIQTATCGQSNGSITTSTSGSVGPYSYVWSNGSTTADIINVPPGTHTVTVTDGVGCTLPYSFDIPSTPSPTLTLTVTNSTCGLSNASIITTVLNGANPYDFIWNMGATTQNLSNIDSGIYTVIFTGGGGCTATATAIVTTTDIPILSTTSNQTTCNLPNGAIDLTVIGNQPYTYNWSNSVTTQDLIDVASDIYTVTVTDVIGCTASITDSVSSSNVLALSFVITPATCGVNNIGTIDLTVTQGTSPFTYAWSTGATTQDLSNLAPGTYTVTVTDANACSVTDTAIVTTTTIPAATLVGTPQNCGLINGLVDLTVSNGTAPYEFDWSYNWSTTEDLVDIPAGTYFVTITDDYDCSTVGWITIGTAPIPQFTYTVTPAACGSANGLVDVTITAGQGPMSYTWNQGATTEDLTAGSGTYSLTVTDTFACAVSDTMTISSVSGPTVTLVSVTASGCSQPNGSIDISISGGSPPYTVLWWSGGPTTEDLDSALSGTYNPVITDASGCTSTISVTVGDTSAPTLSATTTPATCSQPNGSINLTVTGGTSPFTYIWGNSSTTEDISNVLSGLYGVTVYDDLGCSAVMQVNLSGTYAPTVSAVVTDETCVGLNGAINISATGSGTLSYLWNNNATTQDLTGLAADTFTVTVSSNVNTCTTSLISIVNYIPCAPNVVLNVTNATCGLSNGAIDIDISGGTQPYSFIWGNGETTEDINNLSAGQYFVTITDSSGSVTYYDAIVATTLPPSITLTPQSDACSQSIGSITSLVTGGTAPYIYLWDYLSSTTPDLSNLPSGNYTLTVTDSTGCTASATTTVDNLPGPTLSVTVVNTICGSANGSIDLTVTGGTSPYYFVWSNFYYSEDIYNLTSNTYYVTVTDGYNCSATISATVNTSNGPTVSLTTTSSTCGNTNGLVVATANNGTQPYSYQWSGSSNTTATLSQVLSGNYTVTVTDANQCTVSATATVSNIAGPTLSVNIIPEACYQTNGSIDLVVNGGTSPFYYIWSNASTYQDLIGLATGSYNVTVTDGNGCTASQNALVGFVNAPQVQTAVTSATCNINNGLVGLTVNDGTPPYTYLWSNGTTDEDASQLPPDNYSVTVTDAFGCTVTANAIVDSIIPDVVTVSNPLVACAGQPFSATASGVVSYSWSPSTGLNVNTGTDVIVTPFAPQIYTVTGTDVNGCTSEATLDVNPMPLPVVNVSDYTGCSPYTVKLETDTTHVASMTWWFYNGFTSTEVSPVFTFTTGTYSADVIAISQQGCIDTFTFTQLVNALVSPVAEFRIIPAEKGSFEEPVNEFVFINLTTNADNYLWSFGDGTDDSIEERPEHTYDEPGTYNVFLLATNQNGCTDTAMHSLIVEEPRIFFVPNTFTPNGDNNNDEFTIYGQNIASFSLRIYNRSGEMVYSGNQSSKPWDGTMQSMQLNTGVYVYWTQIIFDNGYIREQYGDITLLR